MGEDTAIVSPDGWAPDDGVITSVYGPEEAGDFSDVIGRPPQDADEDSAPS